MFRYRVRGMYATALARLLLDAGAELVDLSKQLAERFGMDQRQDVPPHATVKVSDEDSDVLVVVGKPEAVEFAVYEAFLPIPFATRRHEVYGPYTTMKVKVIGKEGNVCICEAPCGRVEVVEFESCDPGTEMLVHVIKAPSKDGETYVARQGAAVVMDTVAVVESTKPRVVFSEFVKDMERRAELLMVSQNANRRGLTVKWRSAARSAPLDLLAKELEEAMARIDEVKSRALSGEIVVGESIAFIRLSRESKRFLDDVRRRVLATTPRHHEMKSCGWDQNMVEALDYLSSRLPLKDLCIALEELELDRFKDLNSVMIRHTKPDGDVVSIGPAYIDRLINDPILGRAIVLKRTVRSEGVYDGLGVAKEPGDIITTIIPLDSWFLIHVYASQSGSYKGMYININTPPEVCYAQRLVKYIDLYIDVVKKPDEEAKIIDEELLRQAVEKGYVDEDMASIAIEVARDLVARSIDIERKALEIAGIQMLSSQ